MHTEPCTPCSSQQSFVVPVSATDALNPTEWAQNSCVFQTDWNQDGTSPRLKKAAQKVLAETVRFHVEDFGEAGSLFQSLKQGDKKGCQKHIFSKKRIFLGFDYIFFFSKYLAAICIPLCKGWEKYNIIMKGGTDKGIPG